ncbi:MAG: hypothetical protein ACLU80_10825 [Dorea sp.]
MATNIPPHNLREVIDGSSQESSITRLQIEDGRPQWKKSLRSSRDRISRPVERFLVQEESRKHTEQDAVRSVSVP